MDETVNVDLNRKEINTILWYLMPPANLDERNKVIDKLIAAREKDNSKINGKVVTTKKQGK